MDTDSPQTPIQYHSDIRLHRSRDCEKALRQILTRLKLFIVKLNRCTDFTHSSYETRWYECYYFRYTISFIFLTSLKEGQIPTWQYPNLARHFRRLLDTIDRFYGFQWNPWITDASVSTKSKIYITEQRSIGTHPWTQIILFTWSLRLDDTYEI